MNDNIKISSPTLGVVAISYNEERDLPGFLSNLQFWVDEIVIVDDGSTDQTENIAHAAGQKVNFIKSPRADGEYFSHQRNKGIDAAKSEWLLHMDIDERVTPELSREILQAIRAPEMDAFRYRRLNFFLHRPMSGGGWQDWNLVHLARRAIFRFGGMYHEDCLVETVPERIGQLKSKMWHLNDENYLERMNKSTLYCQQQMEELDLRGIKVRWGHFFWLPLKELIAKFLLRKGYRDRMPGLLFAIHASAAKFKACALLYDKQNRLERAAIETQLKKMWGSES